MTANTLPTDVARTPADDPAAIWLLIVVAVVVAVAVAALVVVRRNRGRRATDEPAARDAADPNAPQR